MSKQKDRTDTVKRVGRKEADKTIPVRNRAEEDLRKSEEKYSKAFRNSPIPLAVTRLSDGIFFEVNGAMERFLGYDREELFGRSSIELGIWVNEDDRQRVVRKIAAGEPVREQEFLFRAKDGHVVVAQYSAEKIEIGEEKCLMSVIADITDRKRAEEELRKSERRFKDLFEKSAEAQLLLDHEGKVADCNTAFLGLFALRSKAEVLGHTPEEFGPEFQPDGTSSHERALEVMRTAMEKGSARFEWEHRKHDDARTPIHNELNCTMISIAEQPMLHVAIRDITDRKAADEGLKSSEERLKLLFEYAPDAYYLSDLKGNFIDGNREAEKMLGYGKEELIGKSFLKVKILSSSQLPKAASLLVKNALGKSTGPDEFNLTRKDGTQITIEIRTYPIKIKNQTLVLGIARDITERNRAGAALRESEDRFKNLSSMASEGIMIHEGGVILDANLAFAELLGYSNPDDLIGKNGLEIIPFTLESRQLILDHVRSGSAETYEIELVQSDGSILPAETHAKEITYRGRRARLVSMRDIAERKQAEERLAKSERRFRQLAELLPQIVFETDVRGNITFANRFSIKSFGYKLEDVQSGINFLSLIAPQDQEIIQERFREIMRGTETSAREYQALRKDGSLFPIILHAAAILEAGVPIGVRGIGIDITERKRAEEALRESEEKYRAIAQSAGDAIITADDRGQVADWNLSAERMFGFTKAALVGRSLTELMPLPFKDRHSGALSRIQKNVSGSTVIGKTIEVQGIRKDGSEFPIEVSLSEWTSSQSRYYTAIIRDITDRKEADNKLQDTLSSLRNALAGIIQVLSATTEKRDPYTAGHQKRVADLARAIGQELGLSADRVEGLRLAGTIHDIGKVSIPAEILSKPTRLTEIEYMMIQSHSQVGYDILHDINFSWPLAETVLQHHERMNGSGYPRRLKGEDILLEARILTVSDVVEAMASHRPYRPSLGIEAALEEIEKNKGLLYDSDVVSACLALFREKGFGLK